MQVNLLPLLMVPGVAVVTWTLGGSDLAEFAVTAWLSLIASSTVVSCLRRMRSHPAFARISARHLLH